MPGGEIPSFKAPQALIDAFPFAYYHQGFDKNYHFMGYPLLQFPGDLWVYQQLVFETAPECIIATGIYHGGLHLYLASMTWYMPALAKTIIVGVDIKLTEDAKQLVGQQPLTLIEGDVLDTETFGKIKALAEGRKTMVILDDDHKASHVKQEIELYAPLVTDGQYLVVEDTNVNGHPVYPGFGRGPREAIQDLMSGPTFLNQRFSEDREIWRTNLFTYHTWLKRVC